MASFAGGSYVKILHGHFNSEYMYAAVADDGNSRRYVNVWQNGGNASADPQAKWRIEQDGNKFYLWSANFNEYLYATQHTDGDGRRYIHTWQGGGHPSADSQAWFDIVEQAGNYYITTRGATNGEYLYATQHSDGRGRRFVHTWTQGGAATSDVQAKWRIESY